LVEALKHKSIWKIACGEYHMLALSDENDLFSWGTGYKGELG